MIEFRQKVFTIQEGHFTGSKDMDKIPGALAVVGKSALGGSIIGGVVGKFDKDATIMADALRGGKYGALAGIGFKLFLNHLHKPMTKIKYQDVDKMIRREFGIYRAAGLTIGDKISNKISVDEKFGFNDRKITDYKINISIQDNKICLYTFGMTNEELDKTSVILDYYCSKYFGMEYESRLINQRLNSYAVNIIFTNQQVVSNFIMELSERLNTKINILNSDAVVCNRLSEYMYEDEEIAEKDFSAKTDTLKILADVGETRIPTKYLMDKKMGLSCIVMNILHKVAMRSGFNSIMENPELEISPSIIPSKYINNSYLKNILSKLLYAEGVDYSVGNKKSKNNISIIDGIFVITIKKDTNSDFEKVDSIIWSHLKNKIRRLDNGKVITYLYQIKQKQEFEFILKKLMSCKIELNIFE